MLAIVGMASVLAAPPLSALVAADGGAACADGQPLLQDRFAAGLTPPTQRYRVEEPLEGLSGRVLLGPLRVTVEATNAAGKCEAVCPFELAAAFFVCSFPARRGLSPVFIEVEGRGPLEVGAFVLCNHPVPQCP